MHHSNAGNAHAQYPELLEEVKNAVVVERVFDEFFFRKVNWCKYDAISHAMKILRTINHRQAYAEHVFSHNADVLQKNIKELSIVSKRIAKEYLISNSLQPHYEVINPEMLKHCGNARRQYNFHLEDHKKKNAEKK